MKEKPSYYVILPANVRYDKRLSANERLLFGEIAALSNEDGYCTAKNSYFARVYDTATTTISRWINHLVKYGYLKSEIIYKENSNAIQGRKLYPISTPLVPTTRGDKHE